MKTHEFMRWDGPVLTDSGGFQAFSMSDINSVDDDGVRFKSFVDGSMVSMTPERSMEVQHAIGADIIMAFDDCPPSRQDHPEGYLDRVRLANDRTARWLQRCIDAHVHSDHQALFGIVQGGTEPDERARSAEQVTQMDLPGYAIGGVAVGESNELMHEIIRLTAPMLPEQKPRYLMGVGYERDLLQAVQAGVDMFDCVLPTRNGRKAYAFTSRGPLRLRNASFKLDPGPIEAECDCQVCAGGFSRSYLRHLFMADELLGSALVSLHNIRHFQRLMLDIRGAIMDDSWSLLGQRWPVLGLEPAVSGPGEGLDDDSA